MAAFTNVVTYGDSISDNGTNAPAGDYYGFGVYTDGTPWADQLATKFGASMFNVAYGGATTGWGNVYSSPLGTVNDPDTGDPITGLNWQVNNAGIQSVISYMPKDTTLFTVWAGANDYNRLNALNTISGTVATAAEKQTAALTAVSNIMSALGTLEGIGAKHILVPNLMLLGDGNFAFTYNAALKTALDAFDAANSDIEIYTVDIFNLYFDLFEGYDMTDTTLAFYENGDPILLANGTQATVVQARAMANGLLWVDGYHPGSVAHAAMADAAFNAVAPVPEPATMMLVAFGLIGIAGISRKRTAA